jgi:hypothetical protein
MGVDFDFYNLTKQEYSYYITKMYNYGSNDKFLYNLYTNLERKIIGRGYDGHKFVYSNIGHLYNCIKTIIFIEGWDENDIIEILPDSIGSIKYGIYKNKKIYVDDNILIKNNHECTMRNYHGGVCLLCDKLNHR